MTGPITKLNIVLLKNPTPLQSKFFAKKQGRINGIKPQKVMVST